MPPCGFTPTEKKPMKIAICDDAPTFHGPQFGVPQSKYDALKKVADQLASALENADALNSNAEYWGKQINGVGQTHRDRTNYALHCFRGGKF